MEEKCCDYNRSWEDSPCIKGDQNYVITTIWVKINISSASGTGTFSWVFFFRNPTSSTFNLVLHPVSEVNVKTYADSFRELGAEEDIST
jgi:hypothetical protein